MPCPHEADVKSVMAAKAARLVREIFMLADTVVEPDMLSILYY